MSRLLQVQQESPAKKTRLHCDVDNNLITSTTPNTNTPRKTISRVGRRGSLNGREWHKKKDKPLAFIFHLSLLHLLNPLLLLCRGNQSWQK